MKRIGILLLLNLYSSFLMIPAVEARTKSSLSPSRSSLNKESSIILDDLINSGIQQIHTLNLLKVREAFKKISWYMVNRLPEEFQFRNRNSANYSVNERMVLYISKALEQDPYLIKLLALHEALGASDIYDQNLEVSFLLSLSLKNLRTLSITKKGLTTVLGEILLGREHAVSYSKNRFFILDKDHVQIEGGITSVGGGGDFRAIEFKSKLLEQLLNYQFTLSQILAFLKMEIEVDPLNRTQHIQPAWNILFPERGMIEAVSSLKKIECAGPQSSLVLKLKGSPLVHTIMDDCLVGERTSSLSPSDWVILPVIQLKLNLPSEIGILNPEQKIQIVKEAFEVYSLTYDDPYLNPFDRHVKSFKYRCGNVVMILGVNDSPISSLMTRTLERDFVDHCNASMNEAKQ